MALNQWNEQHRSPLKDGSPLDSWCMLVQSMKNNWIYLLNNLQKIKQTFHHCLSLLMATFCLSLSKIETSFPKLSSFHFFFSLFLLEATLTLNFLVSTLLKKKWGHFFLKLGANNILMNWPITFRHIMLLVNYLKARLVYALICDDKHLWENWK